MDDTTSHSDIRLREGSSIAQRLIMAGCAAAVALCSLCRTHVLYSRSLLGEEVSDARLAPRDQLARARTDVVKVAKLLGLEQ